MANRDLTPWRGGGLSPLFGRDPFANFRQEMDRLFDDFLAPPAGEGRPFVGAQASAATALVRPSIEVHETEQAYRVGAELPGLAEKDIEISLHDNVLTISGEKKSEHEEDKAGRRYTERSYGRFERSIPFPTEIDAERVDAVFRDGVLTITLPKNAKVQEQTRRIEIRQSGAGEPAKGASH